jgi:hypothetical protein
VASSDQPAVGSDRHVVDTVVDLVGRRSYRNARLQLVTHERRNGLKGVAELVARITAPPTTVDPRTEAAARANLPDHLPSWLASSTVDEIIRICGHQSMRDEKVDTLLGRLLAASIVDESAPGREDVFSQRAHLDLRDGADTAIELGGVVDVSGDVVRVEPAPAERPPDRSFTDWLARKN